MADSTQRGILPAERGSNGSRNGAGMMRHPMIPSMAPSPAHSKRGRTTKP
jgi:hypothetical protein